MKGIQLRRALCSASLVGMISWAGLEPLQAQTFNPPPVAGAPGGREGGGTRGGCTRGTPARLTALMPETNLGLTTQERPRFFWFVPATSAESIEFALYSADANKENYTQVYLTRLAIPSTPGIASLALPHSLPPLSVGQDYYWSVSILCDPDQPSGDPVVDGWVRRIAPSATLASELAQAGPQAQVSLYARNGIWFDTLTTLADLRCARPSDPGLSAGWRQLLNSVRLQTIADQPLVQSCASPS